MLEGLRIVQRRGAALFEVAYSASADPPRRRNWQRRRWTCRFHLQRCNGLSALALQAEHLLEAAGENPQTAREAVSAAAWFNFGIGLFGSLIDRGGEGARAVTR